MRLPCASPRQDDFAKWPILNQMPQGFVRLAEGIDALDDRLNKCLKNKKEMQCDIDDINTLMDLSEKKK